MALAHTPPPLIGGKGVCVGVEGWGEELANPRPPMNNNNIDDDDDEDKRVKIELTDTASISGPSV